jgi:hypothetical protein
MRRGSPGSPVQRMERRRRHSQRLVRFDSG